MEKDSGPAGAKDHLHFSGGSSDGAELQNGSTGGFAGEVFRALGIDEQVQAGAAAAARRAFGGDCVLLGDDEDVEAAKGLGIAGKGSVAGGDEDAAQLLRIAGPDLDNAGIEGTAARSALRISSRRAARP